MLIKDENPGDRRALTGLVVLVVGIAIGAFADPLGWLESRTGGEVRPPLAAERGAGPFASDGLAPADNGLETVRLSLDEAAVEVLERSVARAKARGRIVQSDDEVVPATLEVDGALLPAEVRIKGDLLDHVDTDKWSLRIELDEGSFLGMTRFSVQHPRTRGHLWGWAVLAAARHEGLLAPRATFVNVVLNGKPRGVHQLEEHFAKELLESQGRREGPIVRFDEDTFWSLGLTERAPEARDEPSDLRPGAPVLVAEVAAFGEGRLGRLEALNRQLASALEAIRELQRAMAGVATLPPVGHGVDRERPAGDGAPSLAAGPVASRAAARLQELADRQARSIDELLDVRRFARMIAVLSLFDGKHGLTWHNMRFYHDPVTQRLEPVVFDAILGAVTTVADDPLVWSPRIAARVLAESPTYYLEAFRALREVVRPEWLDGFLEEAGPEMELYGAALRAEGLLPPYSTPEQLADRLRHRQVELGRRIRPADAVNFLARIETEGEADAEVVHGTVVVEAWGTTRVPVRLDGFRLGNGDFLEAALHLEARPGDGAIARDGAVFLPWDGRRARFRFPVDTRLATLREIRQITEAMKRGAPRERDVDLTIDAVYALVSAGETRAERLSLRRFAGAWKLEGGRPAAPSLEEALAAHPFLRYDLEREQLSAAPGVWDVEGDLVLPEGLALHAGPGTRLRFREGAVVVATGPLLFEGTEEEPVELVPAEGVESWSGLIVLDSPRKSVWTHVVARAAREIRRGGWMTTGGVTFYRSPVELRSCRFEDARGEDALNVFGTEALLDRVVFRGTFSDAFDGDFVDGVIRDCVFEDVAADAVDTSGSEMLVERCAFISIGDKAVSAGEASTITVTDGRVAGASIGIASKDGSRVDVRGFEIERLAFFAVTAYMKKPEYGPSVLEARGVRILDGSGELSLAETGCELVVDGERQPTRDLDVDELYEENVLGQ